MGQDPTLPGCMHVAEEKNSLIAREEVCQTVLSIKVQSERQREAGRGVTAAGKPGPQPAGENEASFCWASLPLSRKWFVL